MSQEIKCIIGLEIHAQMNTKTKIFCNCNNNKKNAKPNSVVCEVCMGYPGSKPRLNKEVFNNGIKVAKALKCTTPKNVFFSRKNYFYPDMTKNYQITQYEIPVGLNGHVMINYKGEDLRINITRAHIEEDPGKLVHKGGDITNSDYTLIDYNRAGTPLIEIVTDPDFTHPEQVRTFLTKLRAILEHLNVYSNDKIMKADANISVKGGARVEVKNITGFGNIMKALEYEYNRQRIMAKQGIFIKKQETRTFNESSKITKHLRTKESEADYGYIFEPDLSWQIMTKDRLKNIFDSMNELPDERINRFVKEYRLTKDISKVLVYTDKDLADYFEKCAIKIKDKKLLANWMTTHLMKCLNYNKKTIKNSGISKELFIEFIKMIEDGKISERLGKELIKELVVSKKSIKKIIKEKNIKIFDESKLISLIKNLLKKNPNVIKDYKKGKKNSINYLIGQVLKETRFQANVKKTTELIINELKKILR